MDDVSEPALPVLDEVHLLDDSDDEVIICSDSEDELCMIMD